MSLPPITIPDLLSAGVVDPVNDLMLIRQGLTDRKIPVQEVAQIRFESYAPLPTTIQPSDYFLIARPIAGGGYTNYRARSQDVTFPNGTSMWFNMASPPVGWTLDASYADCLLAVKGGAQAYANNGMQGTWQQSPHTLTIAEMPSHSHELYMAQTGKLQSPATVGWGTGTSPAYQKGVTPLVKLTGGNGPHDHGMVWRPTAAVGCIGIKNFI